MNLYDSYIIESSYKHIDKQPPFTLKVILVKLNEI